MSYSVKFSSEIKICWYPSSSYRHFPSLSAVACDIEGYWFYGLCKTGIVTFFRLNIMYYFYGPLNNFLLYVSLNLSVPKHLFLFFIFLCGVLCILALGNLQSLCNPASSGKGDGRKPSYTCLIIITFWKFSFLSFSSSAE